MSKATPGPWTIKRHGYESPYMAHAFIEPSVAAIWWPDGNEEQEANARLIAAAPELLEALKQCEHTPWCDAWNGGAACDCSVPAAIAKAEGR
jgi:hypothetical protein